MDNNILFVFLHIPRTGGTTIVRHIEHKYKKEERLGLYYKELELENKKERFTKSDYQKIVKNYLSKYTKRKLSRIKIVYGHRVPFGIEQYFGKKAYYFTFFRDPIKRSVSLYNFWSTSYHSDTPSGRKRKIYHLGYLVDGKVPSYQQWLRHKMSKLYYTNLSLSMKNMFTRLGYFNTKSYEMIIDKFDFIGTIENFETDSLYIYKKLGVNKYFLNQNISQKFFRLNGNSRDAKLARRMFKDDYIIYQFAKKKNDFFRRKQPEYFEAVKSAGFKRSITLPLTQFYYYPFETIRYIKRKVF